MSRRFGAGYDRHITILRPRAGSTKSVRIGAPPRNPAEADAPRQQNPSPEYPLRVPGSFSVQGTQDARSSQAEESLGRLLSPSFRRMPAGLPEGTPLSLSRDVLAARGGVGGGRPGERIPASSERVQRHRGCGIPAVDSWMPL